MAPEDVFGVFPRLETEGLLLREIVAADADALFAVLSDREVTRYYDLDTFHSSQQARDLIERFAHRYRSGVGIRWGIARRAEPQLLVGTCGYNIWIQPSRRGLIGYDLARCWWRRGIMTEALTALIRFGFARMDLNRIEATVFADNAASHGLLQKLGFTPEGVLREYELLRGAFVDMRIHSLLRREARQT